MTRMKASYPSTGGQAKTIEARWLAPCHTFRGHMDDADLQLLTHKLEQLIQRIEQLKAQNGLLLANEQAWREERAHLIEKNELARVKVEAMISRLKALEQDS